MIVRKNHQIMELLRGAGLTYRVQIRPKMMGVHPNNRDGEGITETGVVRVGDGIGVLGCSKQVLEENAICVELNGQPLAVLPGGPKELRRRYRSTLDLSAASARRMCELKDERRRGEGAKEQPGL